MSVLLGVGVVLQLVSSAARLNRFSVLVVSSLLSVQRGHAWLVILRLNASPATAIVFAFGCLGQGLSMCCSLLVVPRAIVE